MPSLLRAADWKPDLAEVDTAAGKPIPKPPYRPVIYQTGLYVVGFRCTMDAPK